MGALAVKPPRRWVDDPNAEASVRELLRVTPRARSLDEVTRRRLGGKVARVAALPAAAAGWLFVKSAAAGLGIVLGTGAVASYTGLVEWAPKRALESVEARPRATRPPAGASAPREERAAPTPLSSAPASAPAPAPELNPSPSLPIASPLPSSGTLSLEAALLEQARREMRGAPSAALSIAAEHARRFPRGQLSAERTLIQIEALHRLERDAEARKLARGLTAGSASGLYAERVRQLLGDNASAP
jgi:hypothetical protein